MSKIGEPTSQRASKKTKECLRCDKDMLDKMKTYKLNQISIKLLDVSNES